MSDGAALNRLRVCWVGLGRLWWTVVPSRRHLLRRYFVLSLYLALAGAAAAAAGQQQHQWVLSGLLGVTLLGYPGSFPCGGWNEDSLLDVHVSIPVSAKNSVSFLDLCHLLSWCFSGTWPQLLGE